MGFGKRTEAPWEDESEKPRKKKAPEPKPGEFVPSTKKDLEGYAKRAREREEAKKAAKATPEDPRDEAAARNLERRRWEAAAMSELHKKQGTTKLLQNLPIKGLKPKAMIRKLKSIIDERAKKYMADKKNDPRWAPKLTPYEFSEGDKIDDGNFLYAVQCTLAQLSWKELLEVTGAALDMPKFKTTNFSEAFHCAMNVVYQGLGAEVDEDGVSYLLTDRERTLQLWPVEPVRKKMKSRIKSENAKIKAKGREKDEEEDDEELEEEEVEEEEDEDEEEEEKPVKAGKKKSSSKGVKVTSTGKVQKGEGVDSKPVKATKLKDSTVIAKTSKEREGGGKKGALYGLVPKKGVEYGKLVNAAVEEGLDKKDVIKWIPMMIKNGFLQTK